MRNSYQTAMDIQDACNPIAVANTLREVIKKLSLEGKGTDAICSDPAVILIVDKLSDMTGRPSGIRYMEVYDKCEELAQKEEENA